MVENLADAAVAEPSQEELTSQSMAKKTRKKKSKIGKAHPKKGGDEERKGLLSGNVFITVFMVLILALGVFLTLRLQRDGDG